MMQKSPGDLLRRIQVQLQGVFTGQHGHAVCVVLALELIPNRKRHNTHQSCQQNPRHCHALLIHMTDIVQETLQSSFLDSYYTHEIGKNKMTMQDFMKKCFFSVLANLSPGNREWTRSCILQGRGLQVGAGDGGSGRRSMPGGIIQVGGCCRRNRGEKEKTPGEGVMIAEKSESAEPYDSALKHLRGDSNPCFSLERAAC